MAEGWGDCLTLLGQSASASLSCDLACSMIRQATPPPTQDGREQFRGLAVPRDFQVWGREWMCVCVHARAHTRSLVPQATIDKE